MGSLKIHGLESKKGHSIDWKYSKIFSEVVLNHL